MRTTRVTVNHAGDKYELSYTPAYPGGFYDPPESAGVEIISVNGDKNAANNLVLDAIEYSILLSELVRLAEDALAAMEEDRMANRVAEDGFYYDSYYDDSSI